MSNEEKGKLDQADGSKSKDEQNQIFSSWIENEELAEAMIPTIGRLYRDRNVVILMQRDRLTSFKRNAIALLFNMFRNNASSMTII